MRGSNPIEGLMGDPRLLTRVKIENYLLVHLGLRPCSQTTIPAELPGADALGAAIDRRLSPHVGRVAAIADPRRKLAAIGAVKRMMRAAFREFVEASDQYRAHGEWAEALELRSLRFEVRPTVQELYLFGDGGVGKRLKRLMKARVRLRRQALRRPSPDRGGVQLAFPEEFHGGWIREMGELLGYPRCCVDRYADERERGIHVEERAARQLREAERRGPVDPRAHFVGHFFPCAPDCEAALSRGREFQERLREVEPRLDGLYASVVSENLRRVRRQPEIIAEYEARASEARRRVASSLDPSSRT